jgi:hypothetical protein
MKLLFTGFSMTMLSAFLLVSTSEAFPPAPNTLIYGMAKDQYGNALADPSDLVVLQTAAGIQVVTSIQPNLAIGVNFALRVPMDAGTAPPLYVPNALTTGTLYKLYLVINGTTNLPIEMQGAYAVMGAPAQQIPQNLSLGTDGNNDGIPDSWETNFLASIGVNLALGSINPNGIYTHDGRTLLQEYVLGNYPYNSNAFAVTLLSQNGGSALLSFTTTAGRTYTAFGSTDLSSWKPLSFTIPSIDNQTLTSYYSSAVQPLQIQTIQPTNATKLQFFKLQLQ